MTRDEFLKWAKKKDLLTEDCETPVELGDSQNPFYLIDVGFKFRFGASSFEELKAKIMVFENRLMSGLLKNKKEE